MTAPKPTRLLPVRIANAIGKGAMRIGIKALPLTEQALLEKACKQTGLDDFGDGHCLEGLHVFVEALANEARLNLMGRLSANVVIRTYLENRLRLEEYRKQNPDVAEQPIRKPLVIAGLPRTGTSLLHALLARDPAHRAPLGWELDAPCPPPDAASDTTDPRIARVQKQFDTMYKLEPNMAPIHQVGALIPQECLAITAHEFMTEQFHVSYNVASYQAWLDAQSFLPAFETHRRILQHLQHRLPTERWVVKTPGHLSVLDDLLTAYPDACIVHTHRAPMEVMASLASLYYTCRGMASDAVDPLTTGPQIVGLWSRHLERAIKAREQLSEKKHQFFDVQFRDTVDDPIAVVQRIYAHFDIPFSEQARQSMQAYIDDNPRGKRGIHQYTLEDFGLDSERDAQRFETYCEAFGVE
ncbi:MAG: sulfotransferase [bacterium]|nr:sulfotransferase [bacterium]